MKPFISRTLLVLAVLSALLAFASPADGLPMVQAVLAQPLQDTYEDECQGLILKEVASNMGQPNSFNPQNPHGLWMTEDIGEGIMSHGLDVGGISGFDEAHPPGTGTHSSGGVEIFWHPGDSIIRTYWKVGDWGFALVKMYTSHIGNQGKAFEGWDDVVIPVAQKYWKMYQEQGYCGEGPDVDPPSPPPDNPDPDPEDPPFQEPDCSNNSCESTSCDEGYSVRIQEGKLKAEAKTCYVNSREMSTFVCGMSGEDEVYECDFSNNTCYYAFRFFCEAGCEEAVGLCNAEIPPTANCQDRSCESHFCGEGDDKGRSGTLQVGVLDKETDTCTVNSPDIGSFPCSKQAADDTELYACDYQDDTCAYGFSEVCPADCNPQTGLCNPYDDPSLANCMDASCEGKNCEEGISYTLQKGQLDKKNNICYVNSPQMSSFTCGTQAANDSEYYECDPGGNSCAYGFAVQCPTGCDAQNIACASAPDPVDPQIQPPVPSVEIPPPLTGNYDLSIQKTALIQGIEGGQLIAMKPTALRVFLNWPDPSTTALAEVSLMLDGVNVQTIRQQVKNQYTPDERKANRDTVIFKIPEGMLKPGSHTFMILAELDSGSSLTDPVESNNVEVLNDVSFSAAPTLHLYMGSIHPNITRADILSFIYKAKPFLEDTYPVSNVNIVNGFFFQHDITPDIAINQALGMAAKRAIYNSTRGAGLPKADYTVGLFPDDHYGKDTYGMNFAVTPRNVLVTAGNKNPRAHHTLPHEIGHDLLIRLEEYDFPGDTGFFLPDYSVIYRGQTGRLEDFSATGGRFINFMGEAGSEVPSWVNVETWNWLVKGLEEQSFGYQPAPASRLSSPIPINETETPGFLVSGSISSGGSVNIDSMLWLNSLSIPNGTSPLSDYWFQAVGSDSMPQQSAPIVVDFSTADPMPFLSVVPTEAGGAAHVNLNHLGEVIWAAEPSSSPPSVALQTPGDGTLINGSATLSWTASDPDGDSLTYAVLYSADQEASWLPLAQGLTETSFTFDTTDLPGCDLCQMRILASDGWNTSSAVTESGFAVAGKEPSLGILSPEDSAQLQAGDAIILSALAYDLEDGILSGEQFVWQSSLDGQLGTGDQLVVNLSAGTHTITVGALDAQGQQAQDSITLIVGDIDAISPSTTDNSSPAVPPGPVSYASDFPFGLVAAILGLGLCGAGGLAGVVLVVRRRKKGKETAIEQQHSLPQSYVRAHPQATKTPTTPPKRAPHDVPSSPEAATIVDTADATVADPTGVDTAVTDATIADAAVPDIAPNVTWQLVMQQGPLDGFSFPLVGDKIRIGRGSKNDITIPHSGVSSSHARLLRQGAAYQLEDLGSTNGTFVNGQRLDAPRMLQDGDVVKFGKEVAGRVSRV
jgi:pSer/pThr/pTyr-binding forkhead associated (FHA) protein